MNRTKAFPPALMLGARHAVLTLLCLVGVKYEMIKISGDNNGK